MDTTIYKSVFRVVVNDVDCEGSSVGVFSRAEWLHMVDFASKKPSVGDRVKLGNINGCLLDGNRIIVSTPSSSVYIHISELKA